MALTNRVKGGIVCHFKNLHKMVAIGTVFTIEENTYICGARHKSLINGAFRVEEQA